jgi:RNA polymerase sigma-70 factor (ECF subfamily)
VFTEDAFGEFYARHQRAAWTYVYRVIGNSADADDIVQESFVRLLQVPRLPESDEDRRRYLFRIAGNLVTDRWRRQVRDERPLLTPAASSPLPAHDIDVERTFGALKPRERALLWLAYVEGDSHDSIADALRLRRGSVKVLLSRARRRLRDMLAARGLGGAGGA